MAFFVGNGLAALANAQDTLVKFGAVNTTPQMIRCHSLAIGDTSFLTFRADIDVSMSYVLHMPCTRGGEKIVMAEMHNGRLYRMIATLEPLNAGNCTLTLESLIGPFEPSGFVQGSIFYKH